MSSIWKGKNWSPWDLVTRTRITQPVCMSLRLDSWSPVMPSTTTFTSILPTRLRRSDASGSPPSTKSSRSTHGQSSLHISDRRTTTIRRLSKRRGSTSAISTGWNKPRKPFKSFTTRCWSCIRTGLIPRGPSGVPHAQSNQRVRPRGVHNDRDRGSQHARPIQLCFKESRLGGVRAIYSDDYMLVRSDGAALSKQEVLKDLQIGGLEFKEVEVADVMVRIHGEVAILTGVSRTVTSRQAKETASHFRLVAVYVADRSGPRLVHFQSVSLAD